MDNKLIEAFANVKHKPEKGLALSIWNTVTLRGRRMSLFKLYVFSFIGVSSLVSLVIEFRVLLSDFSQSGFYEYLSIAFSDSKFIISYWREFSMLLGESLPLESIILSLSLVFVLFLSLKYATKQIKFGQLSLA